MTYSNIPLAQTLVQLCKLYGFRNIVISPGSRNAPLIIGFTEDDYFKCYSIVDERCAAFFALGISQQNKIPTILVCTSGSAALNYYPAIAEAYFSNIPLVILSADRPEYLLNIGDGQTVNQKNVFQNHIVYSANLKMDISPEKGIKNLDNLEIFKNLENSRERFIGIQKGIQESNEDEINKAFNIAIRNLRPVHINVPFNEPLYGTVDVPSVKAEGKKQSSAKKVLPDGLLSDCAKDWNSAKKKMVLIGVLDPNEIDDNLINSLSDDESVLIFTESTSNIYSEKVFPSIDKIIAPLALNEFEELQPDILMTFGGMVVSKKIKAFLRKYSPQQHWHVGTAGAMDTYFKLNRYLPISPNDFLAEFLPKVKKVESNYRPKWYLVKEQRNIKHTEYLNKIEFSDLKAFKIILEHIKNEMVLQLSNSATIRYSQLFKLPKKVEVFCNRGTSGIDGCTSTAIGCATTRQRQTLLITGDLSFFYDSNSLWNNYIPKSFRIIVLNNQGGGIFRILPGNKNTQNFADYFETIHHLNCAELCKMFGFGYQYSSDEQDLDKKLRDFFSASDKPKLLEIFTPREKNNEILLGYFDYIG